MIEHTEKVFNFIFFNCMGCIVTNQLRQPFNSHIGVICFLCVYIKEFKK